MSELNLVAYYKAAPFLAAAKPLIDRSPAMHHQLVQIGMLVAKGSDYFEGPYGFWTIHKRDKIVGSAIHARPDGLVLSDTGDASVKLLWNDLCERKIPPMRVVCAPDVAKTVQSINRSVFGSTLEHQTTWIVGQLVNVNSNLKCRAGRLRRGTQSDLPLVHEWAESYRAERRVFLDVVNFIEKKLRDGHLYFFDDGSPRSMVTVSGQTKNGARISSVFTPREYRGQGYASSAVVELSKKLIGEGCRFVVLTWAADNEIGNVYKSLGFRQVGTRQSWVSSES